MVLQSYFKIIADMGETARVLTKVILDLGNCSLTEQREFKVNLLVFSRAFNFITQDSSARDLGIGELVYCMLSVCNMELGQECVETQVFL